MSEQKLPAFLPMGPDKDNILEKRPYFLIPLLEVNKGGNFDEHLKRISERLKETSSSKPISDIYVISHGWHRNLFVGASAYDRLLSRFVALMYRGRLKLKEEEKEDYNPLFIALHWHSDPGADGWIDPLGRRNKDSFLENAKRCFHYSSADSVKFTNAFEDIFRLFSRISAADTKVEDFSKESASLLEALRPFTLANVASCTATLEDKVATAWRCYHEATVKGSLEDQEIAPENPKDKRTRTSLIECLLPIVGIGALVAWIGQGILKVSAFVGEKAASAVLKNSPAQGMSPLKERLIELVASPLPWIALLSWLWALRVAKKGEGKKGGTGAIFTFIAYLPDILTRIVRWRWQNWRKRKDPKFLKIEHDRNPEISAYWRNIGDMLGEPLQAIQDRLPKKHWLNSLVTTIHNQTEFYTMQHKAVRAGFEAADFVHLLVDKLRECGKLSVEEGDAKTKIHLIGHSFGGLLVANLSHSLMDAKHATTKPHVRSLCLVQAALKSFWFDNSQDGDATVNHCREGKGVIACTYSRYDTANGSIFPLVNYRHKAAGHVGLYVGDNGKNLAARIMDDAPEERILLVESPDITAPPSNIMNIDASRLIYEGPPASGGGHDDIFKDDVVALIWGVTRTKPHP